LNLQSVFNELRNLQKDFKDVKLTKEHRAKVWNKLDRLFKVVKDKRYGGTTAEGGGETAASDSPMARLKSRYDGLMDALNRMESSIKRDKSDLDFQNQKIAESEGQLEAQIRTAKIKMVVERIDSKMEKLDDMLKTKAELESKMAAQAERDKKNAERAKEQEVKEAAKEAAKEKIAAKIAENQESHAAEADELAKAAAAITGAKKESPKTEAPKEKATTETLMSAVGITLSEAFEDVVDTVKAVAEVVSEKMEEKLEEMKKAVADEDDSPEDTEEK
jgi:chromosome segregation ATPase